MNEEKIRVEKEEKTRTEEIKKKCEDFKIDVDKKFQSTDIQEILADNENLKIKLDKHHENTKKLTENFEQQLKLKESQNQSLGEQFQTLISSKFDALKDQTDKFEKENLECKLEYDNAIKKFNNLTASIKKFHGKFDIRKKEFEKCLQEIYKLSKEKQELRLKDYSTLEKDINLSKIELEGIVVENRNLQEKIGKLKEELSNKIVKEDFVEKQKENLEINSTHDFNIEVEKIEIGVNSNIENKTNEDEEEVSQENRI